MAFINIIITLLLFYIKYEHNSYLTQAETCTYLMWTSKQKFTETATQRI